MDLLLRFLIGGAIVSFFAAIGQCIQPKSFAGLFGAAPSVAIAGLFLTASHESRSIAAVEARYMVIGAIGLIAYSLACSKFVNKPDVPPWLSAGLLWALWLFVAIFLWAVWRWQ
jgi:hypothetical protein